jgi:ribonuclease HII
MPCVRDLLKSINTFPAILDARILAYFRRTSPENLRILMEEQKRLDSMGSFERAARRRGHTIIAGTDEAGRGPLAGPLVAAAVVYSRNPMISCLTDSKKISASEREGLYEIIVENAQGYGIGIVTVDELDTQNLLSASLLAMHRAVELLLTPPEFLLVDGNFTVPTLQIPQQAVVRGDSLSYSIASASILAKVTRDRIMERLDEEYPEYGFAKHKGYGTEGHLEALRNHGPCPHHRRNFAPVRICRAEQLTLF